MQKHFSLLKVLLLTLLKICFHYGQCHLLKKENAKYFAQQNVPITSLKAEGKVCFN